MADQFGKKQEETNEQGNQLPVSALTRNPPANSVCEWFLRYFVLLSHLSGLNASRKVERGLSGSSTFCQGHKQTFRLSAVFGYCFTRCKCTESEVWPRWTQQAQEQWESIKCLADLSIGIIFHRWQFEHSTRQFTYDRTQDSFYQTSFRCRSTDVAFLCDKFWF